MVGKIKKWLLVLAFAAISSQLFAQSIPGQVATDLQEEATKYEQYYEIVLDNALSDYYRKGTYIVDVKATLERVLVPRGYEVVEGEEPVRLENLPGLPFVPPSLRPAAQQRNDSLKASGFDARFRLTRLNIKVLVDTSYSQEDVEFVEEAASLIANANAFRGDIVSVEKKVFPRSARAIEQDAQKANRQQEQEAETKAQVESVVPTNIQQAVPEKKMFLGIDWNNPQQLIYVVIILGVLFLFAILYALLKRPSQKETEQGIPHPMYAGLPPMPAQEEIKPEKKGPDAKTLSQFEEDKTYLTNNCISHPNVIAQMVSQWIASDDEQGVLRAVRGFKSVDEKLLNVLEPHFKVDTYDAIKFAMANADDIPLEEKIEETRAFRRSIQQLNETNGKPESGSNLFDFVYQLTDIQLLHLMKEESDELVAILLAQVAGERAGNILQKMEEEKRISILLKMGKINNIPISVYKKVAAHFSNKALAVSDMKYVAADGIDSILTTIETLPLSEQDDYVRSIAEQDLNLAKRIRKFFLGFDDLPKVKDELVQAALEEVQTETIITALKTAPAAVREKVLKVRPKREQQLILSEIDNPAEVPKAAIEDAQKSLLYAVRRKMKTEG
jgi:flagellar motor switch protein FliG